MVREMSGESYRFVKYRMAYAVGLQFQMRWLYLEGYVCRPLSAAVSSLDVPL